MKLSEPNINTVLHCPKKNKFVETHKNLGVKGMVKGSRLIPWTNHRPIIFVGHGLLPNYSHKFYPALNSLVRVYCSNFWFPEISRA